MVKKGVTTLSAEKVLSLVKENRELMQILGIIEKLNLAQACLCAGAIRNLVWNDVCGQPQTIVSDLDVIFYEPTISYAATLAIEAELQTNCPDYQWEVKNQVYMHHHHPGALPYRSVVDALAHFPENCTAIAVRKVGAELALIAPYGVSDLFNLEVKPTPIFRASPEKMLVYKKRLAAKNWSQTWPKLKISFT